MPVPACSAVCRRVPWWPSVRVVGWPGSAGMRHWEGNRQNQRLIRCVNGHGAPRVRRRGSRTGRRTLAVVLAEPRVSWINLQSQRCQGSGATLPEAAKGLSRVQHAYRANASCQKTPYTRYKRHFNESPLTSRCRPINAKGKECDQPSARAVQLRRAASTKCQLVPTHRSITARGSERDLPRLVSS